MSGRTIPQAPPGTSGRDGRVDFGGGLPRRRRRRWVVLATVVVLILAGVLVAVSGALDSGSKGGSAGTEEATSLATVQRRTLSTQTQFTGTLGYAGSYTVLGQAHGTVTWLPGPGQIIDNGQVLYRVDTYPVVLLYGPVPAYRTLAAGATAADVTGPDVAQVNHDLVALGYVPKSDVDRAWDEFSWATKVGVEKLQKHLGVEQTGKLELGDVVFLPTAARVTTLAATLGAPVGGPVLSATSRARTVSVALDASLQAEVKAGDLVMITLPDGSATPGRVTSVGTVASVASNNSAGSGGAESSGSGATVPVTIQPTHPAGTGRLDQALVEVAITDQTVPDVLAAPVNALLALSGGGYAVETVAGDGTHHLVPVRAGLFDGASGMVQVSGPGLAAGQRVVVPGNA